MSSTNRGYDRHKSDYYVTPIDQITKFLKEFERYEHNYGKDIKRKILDPCAGGDEKNPMSYPEAIRDQRYEQIETIDIREDSKAEVKANYLEYKTPYKYDMIISNPPFNLAMEFINKAIDDVVPGGHVVMLLRLNFFGSKKRFEFFKNNMPKYCFIHHKRMSFTESGTTDSIEYAHFVWEKYHTAGWTKTILI